MRRLAKTCASRITAAPKSAADFAFLLHGFHFLKQDGVMAIILPHGVSVPVPKRVSVPSC
nr:N-6 DNA methylase [Escherichia coli]